MGGSSMQRFGCRSWISIVVKPTWSRSSRGCKRRWTFSSRWFRPRRPSWQDPHPITPTRPFVILQAASLTGQPVEDFDDRYGALAAQAGRLRLGDRHDRAVLGVVAVDPIHVLHEGVRESLPAM